MDNQPPQQNSTPPTNNDESVYGPRPVPARIGGMKVIQPLDSSPKVAVSAVQPMDQPDSASSESDVIVSSPDPVNPGPVVQPTSPLTSVPSTDMSSMPAGHVFSPDNVVNSGENSMNSKMSLSDSPSPDSVSPTNPVSSMPNPNFDQSVSDNVISPEHQADIPAQPSFPQTYSPQPSVISPTDAHGSTMGPQVFVSDHPAQPLPQPVSGGVSSSRKKRFSNKVILSLVGLVVILGGGSAAAYFGYYMSPSVVWSQSLHNTGTGYNRLVSYLDSLSQLHYSGYKEAGSFTFSSGSTNYSGSANFQTSGSNSTGSIKLDTGVANLDLEERSLKIAGSSAPDIYVQLSGIKSLDTALGMDFGPQVDSLDGQWVEVDHNLIADIESNLAKQEASGSSAKLSWPDVYSFLQAAGNNNQKYLFSTNKATAVTKVVHTYGEETVDGHKTIHYKVGFNDANVKAYVSALCSSLQNSGLGSYLKQQFGQSETGDATSACQGMESSAMAIKASDTVDVWADINTRIIYKVRFSDTTNPAQNFVDVGLNYSGGNSYPFFISGEVQDSGSTDNFDLTGTLNSSLHAMDFTLSAESGGSTGFKISSNFSVQPTNSALNVKAPANAIPLTTVLNNLGLSQYVTELENLGLQSPQASPLTSSSLDTLSI